MTDRFHASDEVTVPACLCKNGYRKECPYALPEDEVFVIKGIYSRYAAEDSAEDTTRPHGDFT